VLDLMLVYEIAGVANTADNLAFGLYCEEDEERARLENRLTALVKRKMEESVGLTSGGENPLGDEPSAASYENEDPL